MKTNVLGNSDLSITPIGFGAWAIGGDWEFGWGAQDDAQSVAAIHRALELGVNWIDTAAVYGLGHSEQVVARALKGWSGPRPYIFTKCGLRWDASGQVQKVLRADSIRAEVEYSLRRLGIAEIDLYQIHWPPDPDSTVLEEGWATLSNLKQEGKVRWIGVSNFNLQQLGRAIAIAPVTSLQPPYSLIERSADELRIQLDEAKSALGEAFDELKKVELLDERDQLREREAENAAEQAELDDIALMRSRSVAPA